MCIVAVVIAAGVCHRVATESRRLSARRGRSFSRDGETAPNDNPWLAYRGPARPLVRRRGSGWLPRSRRSGSLPWMTATQRFPIKLGPRSRPLLRLFGVTGQDAAMVVLSDAGLDARFGF